MLAGTQGLADPSQLPFAGKVPGMSHPAAGEGTGCSRKEKGFSRVYTLIDYYTANADKTIRRIHILETGGGTALGTSKTGNGEWTLE